MKHIIIIVVIVSMGREAVFNLILFLKCSELREEEPGLLLKEMQQEME